MLHKSILAYRASFMMANNSGAFKWRHAVYATLITLVVVLSLGTSFSLLAYGPLSRSKNPVARQFAEAIRNLLSNVGFYPEESPEVATTPNVPISSPKSQNSNGDYSRTPQTSPSQEQVAPQASPSQGQAAPNPYRATGSQTPQELGQENYLATVSSARNNLSAMPADRQIKFTLGVHTPIQTKTSNQLKSPIKEWEAIGLVTKSGKPIPLTVGDLQEMFDKKSNTLYENIEAQPEGIAIIDLLAYNTRTDQIFVLPKVRFSEIFRDALNATLNGELKSNTYEIHRLDMNKVKQVYQR